MRIKPKRFPIGSKAEVERLVRGFGGRFSSRGIDRPKRAAEPGQRPEMEGDDNLRAMGALSEAHIKGQYTP